MDFFEETAEQFDAIDEAGEADDEEDKIDE